jgi:drug/metabolite transporter (DMT)-like permease
MPDGEVPIVSSSESAKSMRGYFLIALVSVMWGSMGILQKLAYAYGILPGPLIALRLLISSATLLPILVITDRSSLRISRRDLIPFLLFGAIAVAAQRVTYAYGVYYTTPTITAIMFYTYPVFVTLSAWAFLKEKITWREVLAIILTFTGVALVVQAYEPSVLSVDLLGVFFGLASSLCFVLYFIMTKQFRTRYTGWTVTMYAEGIGAIVLLPFVTDSIPEIMVYPLQLWAIILAIAWILSLLGYLLYSYSLKFVMASKGSILSVLEPLSAAFFSTLLLGESLEALQILGVVLALAGVILLFQFRKPST